MKAEMVCLSHLSDAHLMTGLVFADESENAENKQGIRLRLDFVKYLIMKLNGELNQQIDPDQMYADYRKLKGL